MPNNFVCHLQVLTPIAWLNDDIKADPWRNKGKCWFSEYFLQPLIYLKAQEDSAFSTENNLFFPKDVCNLS